MILPPGVTSVPAPYDSRPDVHVWLAELAEPQKQQRTELCRRVLADWLQVPVDSIELSADERGAPLMHIEGAPGPYVSFSTTGNLLAIAAAETRLGVDIETRASEQTADDVTPLLHPREQAAIRNAGPGERARVFTQLWVRKEALLKAYGTGLHRDLAADDLTTASGAGMCVCVLAIPADLTPAGFRVHAAVCVSD